MAKPVRFSKYREKLHRFASTSEVYRLGRTFLRHTFWDTTRLHCYWTEIVRRMSTQKLVTTHAVNALGERVELRQCSRPSKPAVEIYNKLGMKHVPFKKIKICRSQHPPG